MQPDFALVVGHARGQRGDIDGGENAVMLRVERERVHLGMLRRTRQPALVDFVIEPCDVRMADADFIGRREARDDLAADIERPHAVLSIDI